MPTLRARSIRQRLGRRLLALLAAGSMVLSACIDLTPDETERCPPLLPAFELHVSAADGFLPSDTAVEVRYAGTAVETYHLDADPEVEPEVVFCEPIAADAGSGVKPPGVHAVECTLWTVGAAVVTVQSSQYEPVRRELDANVNECGIEETTEETIVLDAKVP